MRGCPPLFQKDSTTHMDGLAVHVKEGLPFARDHLKKTLHILTYAFLTGFTSFSSIDHLLGLCGRFLILFHLT